MGLFQANVSSIENFSWGYIHTKPNKFDNTAFSPDRPSVHTKAHKSENGVFVAKMDQMSSIHTIVFEKIATEKIWLLSRKRFQKVLYSPSTLTHQADFFKFIHFGERFQKVPFSVTENAVLVWTEGLSGEKKLRFQIYLA